MVDVRANIGFTIAVTGIVLLCMSLPKIAPSLAMQPWRKDHLHPVAALAWSEGHCDSQMVLFPRTPGLQRDDLLEMSGRLDAIEQEQGHAEACTKAMKIAAVVAKTNPADDSRTAAASPAQTP